MLSRNPCAVLQIDAKVTHSNPPPRVPLLQNQTSTGIIFYENEISSLKQFNGRLNREKKTALNNTGTNSRALHTKV